MSPHEFVSMPPLNWLHLSIRKRVYSVQPLFLKVLRDDTI